MPEELNSLLWDHYEDEFLAFVMEEDEGLGTFLQQLLERRRGSNLGTHDPLGSESSSALER